MADQGFKIHDKFYPLVSYEDWLNQDFVLAWKLTQSTTEELFADPVKLEQALVAIAVKHESPGISREQIVEFVGALKPADIEDVGFDAEAAPSPLDSSDSNGSDSSSTRTSDESTDRTPAS